MFSENNSAKLTKYSFEAKAFPKKSAKKTNNGSSMVEVKELHAGR